MTTLKRLRTNAGLTQVATASQLGISLGTYRLWEAGAGKPNKENMDKLKKLLGDNAITAFI